MKRKSLTPAYILLMVGYWCCNITEINYAGIYLINRGYTNGQMGIILAIGNLLAFLLGPVVSSFADKHRNISPIRIAYVLTGLHLAMLPVRLCIPATHPVLFGTYLLALTFHVAAYSMALRVYADYGHSGLPINYGLTRAFASSAMTVLCLCLGGFVDTVGPELLTYISLGLVLLQLIAYWLMERQTKGVAPQTAVSACDGTEKTQALSLSGFIKKNGGYSLMLLGVVLLFVAHNLFYSFSITVIEGVGGDSASMGIANALAVLLEIPIMLGYSRLAKGKQTKNFMAVAFGAFFLKNLFFALANSVYGIYFAILFQLPSFALYSVASVELAGEVIATSDSTKAQSLAFSVAPIGNVLACSIGGFLYDGCGSKSTMFISAAVAFVGMLIALWGLKRIYRKKA